MRKLKIAVVGSGAVGCYYGGMLARAGEDVHFLMRRDLEVVRTEGLRIRSGGEEHVLEALPTYASTSEIGACDLVIVAVKTTSNEVLEALLAPLMGEGARILNLQNGLGNEEFLAEYFGKERVMGGLCFVCLNRVDRGVIEHYGHGSISIGEAEGAPRGHTHEVVEAFRAAGIDARVVENLGTESWRKLVWNVPFNGLTIAAGGVTVADVLEDPGLRKVARELMVEIVETAKALGHDIPGDFIEGQFEKTAVMGPYKPSSLVDYLEGCAVEVESIWGEPLRAAQTIGVPTPRLEMLYVLLRQLTSTES